jgi:hypothetical protein
MVTYAPRKEVNPWTADTYNVAEQGAFVRRMIAQYGQKYGIERAQTFITQAQDTPNPWAADSWSVTAQGILLTVFGMARAKEFARAAGTTVGGSRPKTLRPVNQTFIFHKTPGPAGASGQAGPPGPPGASGASGTVPLDLIFGLN